MKEKILKLIYTSIEDINRQNGGKEQLPKAPETVLFGSKSQLDSLGLINLIVSVEQNIEEGFQKTITLADDRALSQAQSPFSTVNTLATYIETLLTESPSV